MSDQPDLEVAMVEVRADTPDNGDVTEREEVVETGTPRTRKVSNDESMPSPSGTENAEDNDSSDDEEGDASHAQASNPFGSLLFNEQLQSFALHLLQSDSKFRGTVLANLPASEDAELGQLKALIEVG
jgi:hypothetical protein